MKLVTVMNEFVSISGYAGLLSTEEFDYRTRKTKADAVREVAHFLECKICKDVPTPPVVLLLCCSQIVECGLCFESCMQASDSCPLCRAANPSTVQLLGQDGLYSFLKEQSCSDDLTRVNME